MASDIKNRIYPIIRVQDKNMNVLPLYKYPLINSNSNPKLNLLNEIQKQKEWEDYLTLYSSNIDKYSKIINEIFIVISLPYDYSNFKIRNANYVTIETSFLKCNSFLTSYDIIFGNQYNTKIFIINNEKKIDLHSLVVELEYLKCLVSLEDKQIFFKYLYGKYFMIRMEIDKNSLADRANIIEKIESNKYNDFIFRETKSDKIIHPSLNVVFLHIRSKNNYFIDTLRESTIKISLSKLTHQKPENENMDCTFVTYHIPLVTYNYYQTHCQCKLNDNKNKPSLLYQYSKINKLEGLVRKPKYYYKPVTQGNQLYEMSYYNLTVNYGRIKNFNAYHVMKGDYLMSECSIGCILFDINFEPIGITCSGGSCLFENEGSNDCNNCFIPFSNFGLIYLFTKTINRNNVEDGEILNCDIDEMFNEYKMLLNIKNNLDKENCKGQSLDAALSQIKNKKFQLVNENEEKKESTNKKNIFKIINFSDLKKSKVVDGSVEIPERPTIIRLKISKDICNNSSGCKESTNSINNIVENKNSLNEESKMNSVSEENNKIEGKKENREDKKEVISEESYTNMNEKNKSSPNQEEEKDNNNNNINKEDKKESEEDVDSKNEEEESEYECFEENEIRDIKEVHSEYSKKIKGKKDATLFEETKIIGNDTESDKTEETLRIIVDDYDDRSDDTKGIISKRKLLKYKPNKKIHISKSLKEIKKTAKIHIKHSKNESIESNKNKKNSKNSQKTKKRNIVEQITISRTKNSSNQQSSKNKKNMTNNNQYKEIENIYAKKYNFLTVKRKRSKVSNYTFKSALDAIDNRIKVYNTRNKKKLL